MSNNRDFLLKNAVEVGGPTKVTLGSITSSDIDLATGNYFADTPSGTSTYTISNAGDVQSFQLEVTGGTEEVAQNFSTTLYTGNATSRTITNGIDLAGDGGLVWLKPRSSTGHHHLADTERGGDKWIYSNLTQGQDTVAYIPSFNSDGFSMSANGATNANGTDYVSWTFKKEPSFFDVVTYTGDGVAGREIAHNLGCEVGMIVVKCLNNVTNWAVYHRGVDSTAPEDYVLRFNDTTARANSEFNWNDTAPTSTNFTVGTNSWVNTNGNTYVAYLFAHDDAADGLIQCGTFSGQPTSVNLGWQPQWLLCKRTDSTSNWVLLDNKRVTGGSEDYLYANTNGTEQTSFDLVDFTSTGFDVLTGLAGTQVYVAIRAASDLDLTWPSSIEWAGGVAPSAPATGETDVFTFVTDDGGTSYVGLKTADNLS